MTARASNTAMENITRDLKRTTIPRLPPAHGFAGAQEYHEQVQLWKKLIAWEQDDPLMFKDENETDKYHKRVIYAYKQAVMVLRFWPEIWVEAAEWCFANGLDTEGDAFLDDGVAANPESCLVAFKKADRIEANLANDGAETSLVEKGNLVRAPYDKLLDTLYELTNNLKTREAKEKAAAEADLAIDESISNLVKDAATDEDEAAEAREREAAKSARFQAIHRGYEVQTQLLKKTISFVWVTLMRAMRRVQGKGAAKAEVGGSRNIFAEARKRGKLTSDVYIASALMEWHVYKDPAGTKIFERGIKLYPDDEIFILEYLKHLVSLGDSTSEYSLRFICSIADVADARVAFETAVSRLTSKPETIHKAKALYSYFHKYEAQYGELAQIRRLEQRMSELFPADPKLRVFASRYMTDAFDPTAIRPIISPATQLRPKPVLASIEQASNPNSPLPVHVQHAISPRVSYAVPTINSPKRPFPEDIDESRPRKLLRGESPLKGAAGRRLDQHKRGPGSASFGQAPPPLPRDITYLLSLLPSSEHYTREMQRHNAPALTKLLASTYISDDSAWRQQRRTIFDRNLAAYGMPLELNMNVARPVRSIGNQDEVWRGEVTPASLLPASLSIPAHDLPVSLPSRSSYADWPSSAYGPHMSGVSTRPLNHVQQWHPPAQMRPFYFPPR